MRNYKKIGNANYYKFDLDRVLEREQNNLREKEEEKIPYFSIEAIVSEINRRGSIAGIAL